MKKIKLKKVKHKKANLVMLIIITIIISVIAVFSYIGKHITPIIINYAEKQAKKIAIVVITKSLDNDVMNINSEDLFTTNGTDTDYNTAELTNLLKKISLNVRSYLRKLEQGEVSDLGLSDSNYINVDEKQLKNGVIYQIPTGIIFNNGLLSNLGPKIPVKLSLVGDISLDIISDIKEYGINNAIIQLSVNIKVTEQVILPFSYNQITVETNIPLAIKLVRGDVPGYYLNPYTISSQ